jgi:hypothetical protein
MGRFAGASRGRHVRRFLSRAARRPHLKQLSGSSAPDLNPDEGIWTHLKAPEMKNLLPTYANAQNRASQGERTAPAQNAPDQSLLPTGRFSLVIFSRISIR